MAKPTPHPLVEKLALALLPQRARQDAAAAAQHAAAQPPATRESPAIVAARAHAATLAAAEADDLPELVIFAGFVGGIIEHPVNRREWLLLYLDWRLLTWLLVEERAILHAEQIKDATAPSKRRDLIWVKVDASVHRGTGPQSPESRFLRGTFTRAGDFNASLTGGTFSAATGIFCEAKTAGCCGKYTR